MKKRPRLYGFLFAMNFLFFLLLCIDALVGIKVIFPPLFGMTELDPIRFYQCLPEHDRLYFKPVWDNVSDPSHNDAISKRCIIFMGDSVVYGHGIEKDQTIPYHLEFLLKDTHSIMNAGVMAYELHHQVYYAREIVSLKPDEVIFGFCLNDLCFSRSCRLTHSPEDPRCVVQPVTRWNRLKWWFKCYSGLLNINHIKDSSNPPKNDEEIAEFVHKHLLGLLTDPVKFEKQKLICHHYIKDIAELMKQNNIKFTVFILPFRFQYVESDIQKWHDHARLQQAFLDICSSLDIRAIDMRGDLGKIMKERNYSLEDIYLDYDHFSPNGCKVMAELLYPYIKNSESLPKSAP
ncbi:SGNH/GDSL hydrolase family protein [Candidatus Sumerlaeota bacterium]|nr:SGNH/GDSL hydrolase family protein [Candidatus Sumerlaeota bacterium]